MLVNLKMHLCCYTLYFFPFLCITRTIYHFFTFFLGQKITSMSISENFQSKCMLLINMVVKIRLKLYLSRNSSLINANIL